MNLLIFIIVTQKLYYFWIGRQPNINEHSFATMISLLIVNLFSYKHLGSTHFSTIMGLTESSGYLFLSEDDVCFYFLTDMPEFF